MMLPPLFCTGKVEKWADLVARKYWNQCSVCGVKGGDLGPCKRKTPA